jgi:general secretion pathway protein L
MIFFFAIEGPHRWALCKDNGTLNSRGTVDSLDALELPKNVDKVVAVAPANEVTVRKVEVPARSRSKALAAIPYALEETLASDVEQLHFAMLDWKPGAHATVAIVDKAKISNWYQAIGQLPFPVDALIPEYLLIPIHPQSDATIVRTDSDQVCIRTGPNDGIVLDSYSLDLWWHDLARKDIAIACQDREIARRLVGTGGTMVREWDIGADFPEWLRHHTHIDITANLLQGDYKPHHQGQEGGRYKIAGAVLIAAFVIQFVASGYEYFQLASQQKRLNEQIETVFRETFPDAQRIVNPRLQMEQRLKRLRSGYVGEGEFQILLSAVARAIPVAKGTIEEISFRDNALTVTCITRDFTGLDALKKKFSEDPLVAVELLSSGSRDNRVSGRFKIARARG